MVAPTPASANWSEKNDPRRLASAPAARLQHRPCVGRGRDVNDADTVADEDPQRTNTKCPGGHHEIERRNLTINPLADPPLALDLVLIEPSRRPLPPAAEAFLEILRTEAARLDERWVS